MVNETTPNTPLNPSPRVSVVIPAYSVAPYVVETLQSVFAQTFQDFEVLVVNDASPDTPALEAALQPFATRIRYFKQPHGGVSAARNFGIKQACGEFIALLDGDDLWLPTYLESQVEFLNQHPEAVAAISDTILFGELLPTPIVHTWRRPGVPQMLRFEDMLRRKAGQYTCGTVLRRVKAIQAGLFDQQLALGEDVEFCIRVCFPDGKIGYTGEALSKYRRHKSGASGSLSRQEITRSEANCLHTLGRKLPLDPGMRSLLEREIAALEAELAMISAYESLSAQEFAQAAERLAQANTFYHDVRILAATLALKVFPHWTARLLLSRRNSKSFTT